MSDHNEVTVIPAGGALVEFGSFRSPDAVLKEAQMVAKSFGQKARQMGLYRKIGESEHLQIEGWQMLGAMYRVTAGIESTTYVEYGDARGWEARASVIYVPTGQKISFADAMCLDDEDKWGAVSKYEWITPEGGGDRVKTKVGDVRKPLQQLRSMAQTRATSKALSNLLKWVAKMAGFHTTPAEEVMPGQDFGEQGSSQGQGSNAPPRTNGGAGSGPVITEPQSKRLFALAKAANRDKDTMTALLASFGFNSSAEVTKAKYDVVCAAVQDPNWKPPAKTSTAAPAAAQAAPATASGPTGDAIAQMWDEVVRAFKGDGARALQALNAAGHENWAAVPPAERVKIATTLIEEEARW